MDSEEIATLATLQYINDSSPGISRKKRGEHFFYYNPDGIRITDKETISRIKALAIPPAYTKVWISPLANGHIQATGRDNKNRKQYRYHVLWREIRQENKFMSMISF
jgi:DNA topoisomerase-1